MAYPGYEIEEINTVFGFGKYYRYTALEVAKIQPTYFNWCAENLSNAFYFSVKAYNEIKQSISTFQLSKKAMFSLSLYYKEWREEYIKTYDQDSEVELKKLSNETQRKQEEDYPSLIIENKIKVTGTNVNENNCNLQNLNFNKNNNVSTKLINFLDDFFQDLHLKTLKKSDNYINFKYFECLKETKHNEIIDYFQINEISSGNPVVKYLGILTPEDRCVIIEQLFKPDILNSLFFRYLMVIFYITANRLDLAIKVIEFSENYGEVNWGVDILKSGLNFKIPPKMENRQRIEKMKFEYQKETGELERSFINLIIDFVNQS